MRIFTLLPGEMSRSDPPEGGDEPEITEQEIAIIQSMAAAHELDQQKQQFLELMIARCPYTIPSDTMH